MLSLGQAFAEWRIWYTQHTAKYVAEISSENQFCIENNGNLFLLSTSYVAMVAFLRAVADWGLAWEQSPCPVYSLVATAASLPVMLRIVLLMMDGSKLPNMRTHSINFGIKILLIGKDLMLAASSSRWI